MSARYYSATAAMSLLTRGFVGIVSTPEEDDLFTSCSLPEVISLLLLIAVLFPLSHLECDCSVSAASRLLLRSLASFLPLDPTCRPGSDQKRWDVCSQMHNVMIMDSPPSSGLLLCMEHLRPLTWPLNITFPGGTPGRSLGPCMFHLH